MSSVFRYLNSINSGQSIEVEGDYNKFLTGRGLSLYLDTVLLANAINQYPTVDNQLHYDFLKSTVRPKKRFSKWPKPVTHKKASSLSAFFQIPMGKAYLYADLYSDEEVEQIDQLLQQREQK